MTYATPAPTASAIVDVRVLSRGLGEEDAGAGLLLRPYAQGMLPPPPPPPAAPPLRKDVSNSKVPPTVAAPPPVCVLGCTLAFESVEKSAAFVAHIDAARARIVRTRLAALDALALE